MAMIVGPPTFDELLCVKVFLVGESGYPLTRVMWRQSNAAFYGNAMFPFLISLWNE